MKNLTTAEGGALTWRNREGLDNEKLYHELQLLSLHGQSKDALTKAGLGSWEYDIVGPYYKCNMTDIMAALERCSSHSRFMGISPGTPILQSELPDCSGST